MSIFDTVAENRYQQWLERKAKPDYKAPAPASGNASKTSYESRIYTEALSLIHKAALLIENDTEYDQFQVQGLLSQVDDLNIQLTILLEKKNLSQVARMLSDSLRQRRLELGLPILTSISKKKLP